MDMPLNTLTLAQSDALRRILDRVASGRDALVAGDDGHALLDAAAEQLTALRQRAIRVSVPPAGLSLSGLMASITGRPDLAAQDDAVLELGFRTLTVRDDGCDGIVLLVSGADRLQRPALRYIQFACRTGRDLRVVLAGAGLEDAMAAPELAALRTRLTGDAAVAPAPAALKPVAAAPVPALAPPAFSEPAPVQPVFAEPAPAEPAPSKPAPRAAPAPVVPVPVVHAARVRPAVSARTDAAGKARRVAWAAGLGLAASLAFGLWATRTPSQPASKQAAVAPASMPPPPVAAVAAAPAEPAPAALPAAPIPEPAAPSQEAMPLPPPIAAPPAAPPRAASRRPDTRAREPAPVQSLARRPAPAQPRFAQSPPAPAAPLEEGRYPAPPRSLRTEDTFGPMYSTLAQPRSFIGTYSANPDGTRAFRMEP